MRVMRFLLELYQREEFRFLAVGGFNTVFGYSLFTGLCLAFGRQNYIVWGITAHFIAMTVAFFLYRLVVFHKTLRSWFGSWWRFNVASLGNLGLGLCLTYLMVRGVGLDPIVANLFVLVILTISSYLLHKFFSFGRRGHAAPGDDPPHSRKMDVL